jgi:hypothetical protein
VHHRHRGIEDLLEKRFRPLGGDQLSGDLLKMLCSVKLCCKPFLAQSQGCVSCFKLPSSLSDKRFQG